MTQGIQFEFEIWSGLLMSVIRACHKSAVRNFEARATLVNDKVDKTSSKEGCSRGEEKSSAVTGLLHLNTVSLADRLVISIVYRCTMQRTQDLVKDTFAYNEWSFNACSPYVCEASTHCGKWEVNRSVPFRGIRYSNNWDLKMKYLNTPV